MEKPNECKCSNCQCSGRCIECIRGDFVPGSLFGLCDKDGHEVFSEDSCDGFKPIPKKESE